MLMQQLPSALVALLPVIVFLAALLWLDSSGHRGPGTPLNLATVPT